MTTLREDPFEYFLDLRDGTAASIAGSDADIMSDDDEAIIAAMETDPDRWMRYCSSVLT